MKTLYDISWQVSEKKYRADPALSYSTLAKFEREGFDNLSHLFDHISTPSLTLGSVVDTLITGSPEEFDSLFYVVNLPSIGDKEQQIAQTLFTLAKDGEYLPFGDIPDDVILKVADSIGYYANWKDTTRVKVLKERCTQYYNTLALAGNRTVISADTYDGAVNMVNALKNSVATSGYFTDNQPDSPVQRYYQLKFKATLEGVDYRCMADLIMVDYDDKKIYPIDLKTSGHSEWQFQDSFTQWSYFIQAKLYWKIIRNNLDKDDYFKDFTLENYRFIVVNKITLTPLVWEFPYTKHVGSLYDDRGREYRDPLVIGKELRHYLDDRPIVPEGIDEYGVNEITILKPKDN